MSAILYAEYTDSMDSPVKRRKWDFLCKVLRIGRFGRMLDSSLRERFLSHFLDWETALSGS